MRITPDDRHARHILIRDDVGLTPRTGLGTVNVVAFDLNMMEPT
jgi:hypothetical protein